MKILFVVNVDWFFVSHRLPIAVEAVRRGDEVHIATAITDKADILRSHGLTVHPLSMDRSDAGPLGGLHAVRQIYQVMRRVRPDVTHLVTIKPVLLGGIAARLARVPALVAAVSGLGFVFVAKGLKASVRRSVVAILYRLALNHRNLKVIFQNTDDKSKLQQITGLPETKAALIRGSGVDLAEYHAGPLPSGAPVVLFAARLLLDKGVREFVQAARLLRQHVNSDVRGARFVLVGEPDQANPTSLTDGELQGWVEEGVIEHWGYRRDMPAVIASAHVVALPSYYGEGLPKVLIEAAACGRAVVTTDHPGCRDAIEPGTSGVLVPIRDADALAEAIGELLMNPQRCQAMGQAGRELAERAFDVNAVVDQHFAIYQELLTESEK